MNTCLIFFSRGVIYFREYFFGCQLQHFVHQVSHPGTWCIQSLGLLEVTKLHRSTRMSSISQQFLLGSLTRVKIGRQYWSSCPTLNEVGLIHQISIGSSSQLTHKVFQGIFQQWQPTVTLVLYQRKRQVHIVLAAFYTTQTSFHHNWWRTQNGDQGPP